MANGRDLTLGEIALASSVYGDAIDYGRIKIYSTDYLLTKGRISAPNGNIYFPVKKRGRFHYCPVVEVFALRNLL